MLFMYRATGVNFIFIFTADPVKPVVSKTTVANENLSSFATTNKRAAHHSNDVFSRLDDRRDGVFSRLDTKHSIKDPNGSHGNDSNGVTSQSSDTTEQQHQQITTVISKRRIKLTDIKDNVTSSSSLPAHVTSSAHVIPIYQPPANRVVGNLATVYLIVRKFGEEIIW